MADNQTMRNSPSDEVNSVPLNESVKNVDDERLEPPRTAILTKSNLQLSINLHLPYTKQRKGLPLRRNEKILFSR